jgi:hypothetical protein
MRIIFNRSIVFKERLPRSSCIIQLTEYYNGGDTGSQTKYYMLSCPQGVVQVLRAAENEENIHGEWPKKAFINCLGSYSNVTVWQQLYKQWNICNWRRSEPLLGREFIIYIFDFEVIKPINTQCNVSYARNNSSKNFETKENLDRLLN